MCKCGCNQILLECNHIGCTYSERMRDELTAALQRGDSDDPVLQAFVQKYGATVLAAPTTTGFNRVAWIMPFAALGAGIFAVGVLRLARQPRARSLRMTPRDRFAGVISRPPPRPRRGREPAASE